MKNSAEIIRKLREAHELLRADLDDCGQDRVEWPLLWDLESDLGGVISEMELFVHTGRVSPRHKKA